MHIPIYIYIYIYIHIYIIINISALYVEKMKDKRENMHKSHVCR